MLKFPKRLLSFRNAFDNNIFKAIFYARLYCSRWSIFWRGIGNDRPHLTDLSFWCSPAAMIGHSSRASVDVLQMACVRIVYEWCVMEKERKNEGLIKLVCPPQMVMSLAQAVQGSVFRHESEKGRIIVPYYFMPFRQLASGSWYWPQSSW